MFEMKDEQFNIKVILTLPY